MKRHRWTWEERGLIMAALTVLLFMVLVEYVYGFPPLFNPSTGMYESTVSDSGLVMNSPVVNGRFVINSSVGDDGIWLWNGTSDQWEARDENGVVPIIAQYLKTLGPAGYLSLGDTSTLGISLIYFNKLSEFFGWYPGSSGFYLSDQLEVKGSLEITTDDTAYFKVGGVTWNIQADDSIQGASIGTGTVGRGAINDTVFGVLWRDSLNRGLDSTLYADTADYADTALISGYADTALYADTSDYADTALISGYADSAGTVADGVIDSHKVAQNGLCAEDMDFVDFSLTDFTEQTAHRLFYSDTNGDVKELAYGAAGTYLKSVATDVPPAWGAGGTPLVIFDNGGVVASAAETLSFIGTFVASTPVNPTAVQIKLEQDYMIDTIKQRLQDGDFNSCASCTTATTKGVIPVSALDSGGAAQGQILEWDTLLGWTPGNDDEGEPGTGTMDVYEDGNVLIEAAVNLMAFTDGLTAADSGITANAVTVKLDSARVDALVNVMDAAYADSAGKDGAGHVIAGYYLPLSGGTMTGTGITMNGANIALGSNVLSGTSGSRVNVDKLTLTGTDTLTQFVGSSGGLGITSQALVIATSGVTSARIRDTTIIAADIKDSTITAAKLFKQTLKPWNIDSTDANFIFNNAYKVTSSVADSILITREELEDSVTLVRAAIETLIEDSLNEYSLTTAIEALIEDSLNEYMVNNADATTTGKITSLSSGNGLIRLDATGAPSRITIDGHDGTLTDYLTISHEPASATVSGATFNINQTDSMHQGYYLQIGGVAQMTIDTGSVLVRRPVYETSVVAGNAYKTKTYLDATYQAADEELGELAAITGNTGDIIYYTGGTWTDLAVGTADQVLTSNGTTISWEDATGGAGDGAWDTAGTYVKLAAIGDSVGIGTATPSEKLDVVGNVEVTGNVSASGNLSANAISGVVSGAIGSFSDSVYAGDLGVGDDAWIVGNLSVSSNSAGGVIYFDNEQESIQLVGASTASHFEFSDSINMQSYPILTNSTVDGRDVSADGTKLDWVADTVDTDLLHVNRDDTMRADLYFDTDSAGSIHGVDSIIGRNTHIVLGDTTWVGGDAFYVDGYALPPVADSSAFSTDSDYVMVLEGDGGTGHYGQMVWQNWGATKSALCGDCASGYAGDHLTALGGVLHVDPDFVQNNGYGGPNDDGTDESWLKLGGLVGNFDSTGWDPYIAYADSTDSTAHKIFYDLSAQRFQVDDSLVINGKTISVGNFYSANGDLDLDNGNILMGSGYIDDRGGFGWFDSVKTTHLVVGTNVLGSAAYATLDSVEADHFTVTTSIAAAAGAIADSSLAVNYLPRNWAAGKIVHVPLDSSIQDYVTAADSGTTLLLASGTYAITSTITLSKPINIIGQGHSGFLTAPVVAPHGTLIQSATDALVAFQVNANNVRLADLSLNLTGAGAKGINTGNNLEGLVFQNIDVIISCTGWAQGFTITGSDAVMRDMTFYCTSSNSSATGVWFNNTSATTRDAVLDCFNVTGTCVGASGFACPFYCQNVNDDNTLTLNLSNSVCKALTGTAADWAVASTSTTTNNSIVNAYFCTFDGADADAYQSGTNELNLGGSLLANNLVTGTVTYRATMAADSAVIGGGLTLGAGSVTDTSGTLIVGDLTLSDNGDSTVLAPVSPNTMFALTAASTKLNGNMVVNGNINSYSATDTLTYGHGHFATMCSTTYFAASGDSMRIAHDPIPVTNQEGDFVWDCDDNAIEVYDTVHDASILMPALQVCRWGPIINPEGMTDTLRIFYVDSLVYPGGIKIVSAEVQTDVDGAYALNMYEFTAADPPVFAAHIDTLNIGASDQREQSNVFTDSDIAVGAGVYINTPATDIYWVSGSFVYYAKEND